MTPVLAALLALGAYVLAYRFYAGFLAHRIFRLDPEGLDAEELELEMIDHGLQEMGESTGEKGESQWLLRCDFGDFGTLQKGLEEKGITPLSSELEQIPMSPTELPEEQADEVLALVDRLEQDEDVQKVFHSLV